MWFIRKTKKPGSLLDSASLTIIFIVGIIAYVLLYFLFLLDEAEERSFQRRQKKRLANKN
jgi:hypothetical protein